MKTQLISSFQAWDSKIEQNKLNKTTYFKCKTCECYIPYHQVVPCEYQPSYKCFVLLEMCFLSTGWSPSSLPLHSRACFERKRKLSSTQTFHLCCLNHKAFHHQSSTAPLFGTSGLTDAHICCLVALLWTCVINWTCLSRSTAKSFWFQFIRELILHKFSSSNFLSDF